MSLMMSNIACWVECPLKETVLGRIYRGYYTVERRYEFYVREARTIKFISSSHRVMFFLLYAWPDSLRTGTLAKQAMNDTTLTKVTYRKYATRVPDEVAYGIYEWFSSQ